MKNAITLLLIALFCFSASAQNSNVYVELMGSAVSGASINYEKTTEQGKNAMFKFRVGLGGTFLSSPHESVNDRIGISPILGLGFEKGDISRLELGISASAIIDPFNPSKVQVTPLLHCNVGYKIQAYNGVFGAIHVAPVIHLKSKGMFPLQPWLALKFGKAF